MTSRKQKRHDECSLCGRLASKRQRSRLTHMFYLAKAQYVVNGTGTGHTVAARRQLLNRNEHRPIIQALELNLYILSPPLATTTSPSTPDLQKFKKNTVKHELGQ